MTGLRQRFFAFASNQMPRRGQTGFSMPVRGGPGGRWAGKRLLHIRFNRKAGLVSGGAVGASSAKSPRPNKARGGAKNWGEFANGNPYLGKGNSNGKFHNPVGDQNIVSSWTTPLGAVGLFLDYGSDDVIVFALRDDPRQRWQQIQGETMNGFYVDEISVVPAGEISREPGWMKITLYLKTPELKKWLKEHLGLPDDCPPATLEDDGRRK